MALAMAEGTEKGDPLLTMDSGDLAKELDRQIESLKEAELAMAPRDFPDAGDIPLRVRGEVSQHGPIVPRSYPSVLYAGSPPSLRPGASGRLEFADWIVSPENALLDRVIVNRVWAYLFGRGLVASVDNFGVQGERPTHPELLDYLPRDSEQRWFDQVADPRNGVESHLSTGGGKGIIADATRSRESTCRPTFVSPFDGRRDP